MTTPQVKLFAPHLRVVRQVEENEDPKAVEVQTTNADLVLWDRTRSTHKWPKFDDAPFLWQTFLAWAAMRRSGLIPLTEKYETFEATTLSIEIVDDDETDPTNTGPGPV